MDHSFVRTERVGASLCCCGSAILESLALGERVLRGWLREESRKSHHSSDNDKDIARIAGRCETDAGRGEPTVYYLLTNRFL